MARTKQTLRRRPKHKESKIKKSAQIQKIKTTRAKGKDATCAKLHRIPASEIASTSTESILEKSSNKLENGTVKKTTDEILEGLFKYQKAIGDIMANMGKTGYQIKREIKRGLSIDKMKTVMSSDQKLLKDLQIKTNVVKRLAKEYHAYEKETEKQKEKIEKMKADPAADEYAIKKMNEVLQETRNMLPMTASRVKKACVELNDFIEQNKINLGSTEQLTNAYEELKSADSISC